MKLVSLRKRRNNSLSSNRSLVPFPLLREQSKLVRVGNGKRDWRSRYCRDSLSTPVACTRDPWPGSPFSSRKTNGYQYPPWKARGYRQLSVRRGTTTGRYPIPNGREFFREFLPPGFWCRRDAILVLRTSGLNVYLPLPLHILRHDSQRGMRECVFRGRRTYN